MGKRRQSRMTREEVEQLIADYPSQYPTPKYLLFMRYALDKGFQVSLHRAVRTVSKYVFVYHGQRRFKVRFSNHVPALYQELTKDCDFYVGICNTGVTTTRQAWFAMLEFFGMEATNDNNAKPSVE